MVSRKMMNSLIRMAREQYQRGTDVFYGMATENDKNTLLVAAVTLNTGDIVGALNTSEMSWLVLDCQQLINHESYKLGRILYSSNITRFTEGAKDSFGRSLSAEPAAIYSAVPLHLKSNGSSTDSTTPDRSAETSSYEFLTSADYQIKAADRLTIGGMTFTVTGLLLAPPGLMSFTCSSLS